MLVPVWGRFQRSRVTLEGLYRIVRLRHPFQGNRPGARSSDLSYSLAVIPAFSLRQHAAKEVVYSTPTVPSAPGRKQKRGGTLALYTPRERIPFLQGWPLKAALLARSSGQFPATSGGIGHHHARGIISERAFVMRAKKRLEQAVLVFGEWIHPPEYFHQSEVASWCSFAAFRVVAPAAIIAGIRVVFPCP